ncbi:MAG: GspH/FimT family pseudopilin [Candidatus Accumulibacter sp.]|jgi:type IV fimbrial biogenesis protein FimT|nr:GspH/FimT family pseudopilin [Accumulibacter sp.]
MNSHARRGFTLIELLVGIVLLSILMALAVPNFSEWIRNSKIRTTAESIQNGLQLARAEAVRRNTVVRFQLVNGACQMNENGPSWFVSLDEVTGECTIDPEEVAAPRGIQFRSGAEAADAKMQILSAGGVSSYVFNSVGRLVSTPSAINVTNGDIPGLTCKSAGGGVRCLRVVVSAGGQIRMCDPALPSSDTQGC